jgi:hypothetical protein
MQNHICARLEDTAQKIVNSEDNSKWASPALVVKKSDGGRTMTVDLRGVNALCESMVSRLCHSWKQ